LKARIKCLIALVVVLMASSCVSASNTTTKFQTGPFSVSIDLGESCNDINISEPAHNEWLDGTAYTSYIVELCGALVSFTTTDNTNNDLNTPFGTDSISHDLIELGADKDTISVYNREINGMPGAVGSGYMPKYGTNAYSASYYVSKDTVGHIFVWGNESKIKTALKTIHVT
jgi:hypothetical protein